MSRINRRTLVAAPLLAALALAAPASAGDGVIEINQAKAVAGGVTPTDTPGFPVTLTSGSYRLTGEITVPADVDGIEITSGDVTLDLNGFGLHGPGAATGSSGSGIHVKVGTTRARIANGTVADFRGYGVYVVGLGPSGEDDHSVTLDTLAILRNGADGAYADLSFGQIANNLVVTRCVVSSNLGYGIAQARLVEHSLVDENGLVGIRAREARGNTLRRNGETGIAADVVIGNVLEDNNTTDASDHADIIGGVVLENIIRGDAFGHRIGIIAGSDDVRIAHNTINNTEIAIQIGPALSPTNARALVEGNVIHEVSVAGIQVSRNNVLYLNNRISVIFGGGATAYDFGAFTPTDGGGNIVY